MLTPLATVTAAAALLAVGAAGGVALVGRPPTIAPATTKAAARPVEVRTQVIHRTEHVVRHERRTRRSAPAISLVQAPPRPRPAVAAASAPRRSAPFRTRSSPAAARSGDDGERQGMDD